MRMIHVLCATILALAMVSQAEARFFKNKCGSCQQSLQKQVYSNSPGCSGGACMVPVSTLSETQGCPCGVSCGCIQCNCKGPSVTGQKVYFYYGPSTCGPKGCR